MFHSAPYDYVWQIIARLLIYITLFVHIVLYNIYNDKNIVRSSAIDLGFVVRIIDKLKWFKHII